MRDNSGRRRRVLANHSFESAIGTLRIDAEVVVVSIVCPCQQLSGGAINGFSGSGWPHSRFDSYHHVWAGQRRKGRDLVTYLD